MDNDGGKARFSFSGTTLPFLQLLTTTSIAPSAISILFVAFIKPLLTKNKKEVLGSRIKQMPLLWGYIMYCS
jgi:hypothetical protein